MNTMSLASVRKLINKSISSSKSNPKSHSFSDENSLPLHPNIQINQPNPKKSHHNLDFTRSHPTPHCSLSPDPGVKVVVRIRPNTVVERLGDPTISKVSETAVAAGDRKFSFDHVFDSKSKQEDVFELVGVPLVKDALAGYNASVLCYGQIGSGKTYTMWGPPSSMVEGGQSSSNQQGIVPRIFQMLFSEIEREKNNSNGKQINYQCRCSFLEIYNGQIGDLLDPTHRNLKIKDNAKNGFYIENLTEEYVTSFDDVTQILLKGLCSRKVGATSINSKSSRSHIVFTCVIESWCKDTPSSSFSSSKTSRISLVDLAGLQRNKPAEADKEFDRELKDVKNSLSQLGHLVNILAKGSQADDLMYRDSCLTHLLQQSLGGNAKLSVICAISPDIKNIGDTLSTLRFGQRIGSIQNKPIINEVTEEDMDDLTDQIRHLKEELIRAKLNASPPGSRSGHLAGKSVRESVDQLRLSLNRSLILPHIDNNPEIEINADESDVTELCKHLEKLHKSCEGNNPSDMSFDTESLNFASVRGSCDSYFTSEHEVNCLHESEEADLDSRSSISVPISCHPTLFEEPTLSESPKIKNIQRKSVVNSPSLLSEQKSVQESETRHSSLRSSKIFSGPTESLAASLKRGLEIIDQHQQNSSLNKSLVSFSFEHLMLKPSPAADKVNASVQTLEGRPSVETLSSLYMCGSCRQKEQSVKLEVEAARATDREKELEKICAEQSAKIEELNCLVEKFKMGGEDAARNSEIIEFKNPEPEIIKETYEIKDKPESGNNDGSIDVREREELLMEIQFLKNRLQAYTDAAPNKSIDKLRSSLLSRSMQIRRSMSSQFSNAEEMEKERQKWTEMESEWINLTDELRIDIDSHRQHAEKVEMELHQERNRSEELDDALHRAVLGHARFVEHYVDLQEKYNHLSESHRRIMETVMDVKKAAAKAGAKGSGARYAKAFAAELSTMRAQEKRERERLRRENTSLKIQLRETAEAVQTAGELLVRLREAEEVAAVAESSAASVQQENEKLRRQLEKVKNKHKMEMVTMKQYMAESKLPESALRPVQYEEHVAAAPSSAFVDDDEAWRSEFGATYNHHY